MRWLSESHTAKQPKHDVIFLTESSHVIHSPFNCLAEKADVGPRSLCTRYTLPLARLKMFRNLFSNSMPQFSHLQNGTYMKLSQWQFCTGKSAPEKDLE